MLAGAADRDQDHGDAAAVHQSSPHLGRNTDDLALPHAQLLAFKGERQLAAQHDVDLFLVAVAMNATLLTRLQRQDVEPEARGAELASQALESLAVGEFDSRVRDPVHVQAADHTVTSVRSSPRGTESRASSTVRLGTRRWRQARLGEVLLQATLNGGLSKRAHPAVPISVEELAHDAAACATAGARAIHLHPRDSHGRERLNAEVVDAVVDHVRNACGVPVGVTTGAWIEPDLGRRLELVRSWSAPDYASVNVSEPGATEIMKALVRAGVGIEAGVWSVEDAEFLAASGVAEQVTRVLIEPVEVAAADAIAAVEDIHGALGRLGIHAPRLQHGDGDATWLLLTDAISRGIDTRIGLEDTLYDPKGELTAGNEALVRAARQLGAGAD